MTSALEKVKQEYLTEAELVAVLGVKMERVRDLRSNHNTGKKAFIAPHSVSAKAHLYHIDDVLAFIKSKKLGFEKSQT